MLIFDYGNTLFTSSVCVGELIHLCQIGKVKIDARSVMQTINDYSIHISAVTEKHLSVLSELPMFPDHRDPNDRLIIAQAIADRVPLISSDGKFSRYKENGLNFIYNER